MTVVTWLARFGLAGALNSYPNHDKFYLSAVFVVEKEAQTILSIRTTHGARGGCRKASLLLTSLNIVASWLLLLLLALAVLLVAVAVAVAFFGVKNKHLSLR